MVYILNRPQIRVRTTHTPYELWNAKIENVKNFKKNSCKCFIKKNDDSLENFNSRSNEGIFLGYSTHSKAYKFYNKRLNKIVEAINVVFDENSMCYNNKEDHEETSFQKLKTLHDEHLENVEIEPVDETKPKNYSSPKVTSTGSKIKTSSTIIAKRHSESQVIGDVEKGILTRRKANIDEQANIAEYFCLISDFKPKSVTKALSDSCWKKAMQE